MANYTQNVYNLVDVTKSLAPDNKTMLRITDLIKVNNEIQDDLQWTEGTGLTTHVMGQRVALPEIKETIDNKGYGSGKQEIRTVEESACEIGSDNPIDIRTAHRHPKPLAFRAAQDDAHIVAHSETLVNRLFNGNRATNPMQINGLYNRSEWSGTAAANPTTQILAGTGYTSSDLYDIWLVAHGTDGLRMWYPRGSIAGLKIEDKGEQRVLDANNDPYYAYVTNFSWQFGIEINDPRNIIRIKNVKPADTAQTLEQAMIKAINKQRIRGKNSVFYLPRAAFDLLDIRGLTNLNAVRYEDVFGRQTMTFRGIPVRCVEYLDSKATLNGSALT